MIPVRTSIEVQEIPGTVIGLIIANVAVFLVQSGLPADLAEQFIQHNALVPARYTQPDFARQQGLDPGNYLPLLTNTFMHAGWLHLLVNMWTLWLFGRPLEERLGAVRFVLFYLVSGAIASLAHFAFNLNSPLPALGASGAIAGILGGYTLLYPRARVFVLAPVLFFPIVFRLPAVAYTAIWFVFQLVSGVAGLFAPEPTAGIAWWAHIGGFVAGLALIMVIGVPRRRTREIGQAPVGMREIGGQRSRVLKVGPERRRIRLIGAYARRKEKPAAAPSRSMPGTLPPTGAETMAAGQWEAAAAPEAGPDEAFIDTSHETVARTGARRRGPWV